MIIRIIEGMVMLSILFGLSASLTDAASEMTREMIVAWNKPACKKQQYATKTMGIALKKKARLPVRVLLTMPKRTNQGNGLLPYLCPKNEAETSLMVRTRIGITKND